MTSNYSHLPHAIRIGGKSVSRAQTTWAVYILCVALYATLFGFWQAEPVPFPIYALGVLVAAICLIPLSLWAARGSRDIPAFELVCLSYLLAFSSPLFLQKNQIIILSRPDRFIWEETYQTLIFVAIGVVGLIVGYYIINSNKLLNLLPSIDLPLHPKRQLDFIKLAFATRLILSVLQVMGVDFTSGVFASFVNLINNQAYVAIVLLAYRVFRGQEEKQWTVVLCLAIAFSTLFGVAKGVLEDVLVPLVLIFIVRWNVSKKIPMSYLGVGLILFVLLNSVKGSFRNETRHNTDLGVADRISLWLSLSLQAASGKDGRGRESDVENTIRNSTARFDLLHQFIRVQQLTPSTIPYYEGKTYNYIFYGWIPRFFWPDKPIAQQANQIFAIDYKLIMEEQKSAVMMGIGHLPEAYANFGAVGVAVIMALQGMFLAFVNKILNGPGSEGGRAIYLSIMVFFFNGIGSGTASLFMIVIPTIIVNGLILRFFATGWKHNQVAYK